MQEFQFPHSQVFGVIIKNFGNYYKHPLGISKVVSP